MRKRYLIFNNFKTAQSSNNTTNIHCKKVSTQYRFWMTNLLHSGVYVRLIEVSAEYRFILRSIWEEKFGTEARVHLIWGPLNTGFIVSLRSHFRVLTRKHRHLSNFNVL